MKESWSAFVSTRPQALLATVKAAAAAKGGQQQKGQFNNQGRAGGQQQQGHHGIPAVPALPNPYFDNIRVKWNQGRCLAAPGTCTTKKGLALRHCCNFRPNPATPPHDICQQNHAAIFYHR